MYSICGGILMSKEKELVTWNEKLACGLKPIDEQHKKLVELVNDMFRHATGNSGQEHEYFNSVIREVVDYVKYHFAAEEKILMATKYANFEEHKKEHEKFIQAIIENIRSYESGKRVALSNFTRFLRDWILSHIALVDKQYFEYFRKIATRKDDGKLTINMNDISNAH